MGMDILTPLVLPSKEDTEVQQKKQQEYKLIDWEERRYQLARAAMQGIFAKEDEGDIALHRIGTIKDILLVADEMIKQLKGE